MLILLTKQSIRLIEVGAEDRRLCREFRKYAKRGKNSSGWISKIFTLLFACVAFAAFGFAAYLQSYEKKQTDKPMLRVVYSNSMADKYKENDYLFENDLNNQFKRFDIVVTHALPQEEDLQLYDIVVYEVDGTLLIHRIVEIEEPNEKHAERHFRLQGDAVENPDRFPVKYEQMIGIYKGEKIENVGHFVMFLQSPAGYMCMILLVVSIVCSPFINQAITRAEKKRLKRLR